MLGSDAVGRLAIGQMTYSQTVTMAAEVGAFTLTGVNASLEFNESVIWTERAKETEVWTRISGNP